MTKEITVTGYPFVSHVDQAARPQIILKDHHFRIDSGLYKNMGYLYDLRPHMRRFLYLQYGSWHHAYAKNKTALRKNTCGTIDEIHEIPNPHK